MKKIKLLPSVLMLALCIGILGIGIYAANPTNNVITGTITVNAANAGVTIQVFKGTDTSVDPIGTDTGRATTRIELTGENAIKIDASEAENLSQVQAAVYTIRLSTTSNIKLVVDTETIEWRDGTTATGTITDALKITKVHTPAATDTSTGLAYFNNAAGVYDIVCSINLTDLYEEDFTSELDLVINVYKLDDWVKEGNTGINGIDYLHLGEYPQAKTAETSGFGEAVGTFGAYNDNTSADLSNIEVARNVYAKDGKRYVEMSGAYYEIQPLKWRILDKANGEYKLMCDTIIEQVKFYENESNRTIDGQTIYPNNYKESSLRKFLTTTFLNNAFSDAERNIILEKSVGNTNSTETSTSSNTYACADTTDKIFALSYQDLQGYDFGTSDYSTERQVKVSDYGYDTGVYVAGRTEEEVQSNWFGYDNKADCMSDIMNGWGVSDEEEAEKLYYGLINSGYWWLRSPDADYAYYARCVSDCGYVDGYTVSYNYHGCVPAMVIGL